MSNFVVSCVNNIFKGYDYNNLPIKYKLLKDHNTQENAWIAIDKTVYSIRKDDILLLDIFKDYYGKNVKDYLMNDLFFNLKKKILIMEKLKNRKIGYLVD
jgi:hypothetical protein